MSDKEKEYFRTASITFEKLISGKWLKPEHHGKTASDLAGEVLQQMRLLDTDPLMTSEEDSLLFAEVTAEFIIEEYRWIFMRLWRNAVEATFKR